MEEPRLREEFAKHWIEASPSISSYVFASVAGFHDAEDVIQRIAQELARRFNEYDPERPFLGWALWIAKSRVIDFYRSRPRSTHALSDEILGRLADTFTEQAEQGNQRQEALEACLDQLPERSRKLLDLRYVDDLSTKEVAQKIGSTNGSVRVLLSRIRTALANCIQHRTATEQLG